MQWLWIGKSWNHGPVYSQKMVLLEEKAGKYEEKIRLLETKIGKKRQEDR